MSKHSRKMTKMSQNKRKKKGKKIVILLGVLVVILLGIGCGSIPPIKSIALATASKLTATNSEIFKSKLEFNVFIASVGPP